MSYRVDLAVLSEQKQFCRFGLTLHNLSDQDINNWSFNFIMDRFIQPDSLSNGVLDQIGSFCVLTPKQETLKANAHFYCEFSINTAPLRFYTDGLKGAVLIDAETDEHHSVAITPIALASPHRKRADMPDVAAAEIAIIPQPVKLDVLPGHYVFNKKSQITLLTSRAEEAATWLQVELNTLFDFSMQSIGKGDIRYRTNPILDEGNYQLTIDQTGACLEANSASGFVHASATFMQLLKATSEDNQLSAPYVKISDSPRFKYRGMMLDCSRHFHPVERVKRLINQLAHYKFNTFHWHLTDDEGWRVEIKAFPQLTDVGASRSQQSALEPQFSHIDQAYNGYYTQEEIKHVIAFAEQRGITIIPEIDVPGHCRAAIKALPDLLVDSADQSQYRSIQNYTDNVLSPGLEGTYEFLERVLEEVAELFPSKWVHIGADEVPHGVWEKSAKCQALMKQQGYTDTKELQGHLLRFAEKKLRSLGKRMVGWEEAQHGDKVSKETVIYSWLSEEAALKCAKQGFDVVLQPAQHTYLDMAQDYAPEEPGVDWANVLPLEQAYRYEPLAEIPDSDPIKKRILGIQCALWCEIVTTQERMDYMIFPRLTAMAEACWTNKPQRDWNNYLTRLKGQLPLLNKHGIQYCSPWKKD
ncbi:beta-N-acetylhexosaminidase [Vibrio genomosp. F10]|uniref:beta-N-acetylhexosaminidase n=1 Tax=Vibrio genomosp. F10 TaxID=723171 RepID=UPI000474831E|nr:family 20 glycosylhydrolase [Vibrio genomosp. F10]OEF04155.1 beta-hexosaminidase [Vibrio genomosp. F10 str. 9ZB36]